MVHKQNSEWEVSYLIILPLISPIGKLSLGHNPTFLLLKTFYNKNKESETKEGSKIIFEKRIFISQSKNQKKPQTPVEREHAENLLLVAHIMFIPSW